MHQDVCGELGTGFNVRRFVPYIQLHEFEALLFCGPKELSNVLQAPTLEPTLREIVEQAGEPEAIDDDPSTTPSKRISSLAPRFQKTLHGATTAQRIGLERLRAGCRHFAEWLVKLETLA